MSESLQKLIGQKIRQQRKAANLSQEKLGELVHYSDETISAFERGDREPGLFAAFNMAEALGCSVEDFRPEPEPFDY
ncbi:MAG: helix-turn-helix transcriptional regulator [Pleurocapsa sp. MO_226.B13]|nr:helix-turn-helix transcriptional regulator [Pleurocapsa sp. MO_226.B13]